MLTILKICTIVKSADNKIYLLYFYPCVCLCFNHLSVCDKYCQTACEKHAVRQNLLGLMTCVHKNPPS